MALLNYVIFSVTKGIGQNLCALIFCSAQFLSYVLFSDTACDVVHMKEPPHNKKKISEL